MNGKNDEPKYQLITNTEGVKVSTKAQIIIGILSFLLLSFLLSFVISMQVNISKYKRNITGESLDDLFSLVSLRAQKYGGFDNLPELTKIGKVTRENKSEVQPLKMVCYYTMSDNESTSALINSFDSKMCTHLIVAFAGIRDSAIYITKPQREVILMLSKHFKSSDLKLILSVGGYGNEDFETMVYDHANRKTFIKSIVTEMKECGLDGIDLDWEFPSNSPSDKNRRKQHFAQLLIEIRGEINRHEKKHRFSLSVCVAAAPSIIDLSYNIPSMNDQVDFINVMCYDYHFYSALTPMTGFNAPLYPCQKDSGIFKTMNINYTLNYLLQLGMDRKKIVVGLPTYAHSFKLVNKDNNFVYAPAQGYGSIGALGFLNHSNVCNFINDPKTVTKFDSESKCPYAYQELQWISYDNEQSLTHKAEYIKNNNFGGAMIYDLNADNFRGENCKQKDSLGFMKFLQAPAFPLTATVKSVLFDDSI